MPVFHTKTIEATLEPVAQQVSQLVILHEEAQDGNAMPDISALVGAVGPALENLVKVGKKTAQNSKDEIMRKELPPACTEVEEASTKLTEACMNLKQDPYSSPARQMLMDGARGILSGTSDLLLCFDQSEVRKIVAAARQVLEYVVVAEVIEILPDAVTFLKNLSPGLLNLAQKVEGRCEDLTCTALAKKLTNRIKNLKNSAPLLISSLKVFVTTLEKRVGRDEAQQNRNFVIRSMLNDMFEIIRILQLTSTNDDFAMDDLTIMKKASLNIKNRLPMVREWLSNPDADPFGLGEKAVRDILNDARQIDERSEGEKIPSVVNEIGAMMDELCQLRTHGLGNSADALQLAKTIDNKLDLLNKLVDDDLQRAICSEVCKPAYTLAGKVEQAQMLPYPAQDHKGVGIKAVAALVSQGRKQAEDLSGPERADLTGLCDEVEKLSREVTELASKGMGNSPQCQGIFGKLSEKLLLIQRMIGKIVIKMVVDDFMDTATPMKQLEKAAKAPVDAPCREKEFDEKATIYLNQANKMSDSAKRVAETGANVHMPLIEDLNTMAEEVNELAPQVVAAAKVLLLHFGDKTVTSYFEAIKNEYVGKVDALTDFVDKAMDAMEFVKVSDETIKKDSANALEAMDQHNARLFTELSGNIARRANRIVAVASKKAANSDDPEFSQGVGMATKQLSEDVQPIVTATKAVALNILDTDARDIWSTSYKKLEAHVMDVNKVLADTQESPPPPLPDMSELQLEESSPGTVPPPKPEDPSLLVPEEGSSQPIMQAAFDLHVETAKWSSKDNDLMAAAKRMAQLMAAMSKHVSEETSRKELIEIAEKIAAALADVARLVGEITAQCTDKYMKNNLLQVCERIPIISTQLKIFTINKAVMLGSQDPQAELEATELLVGNAQNLMKTVKETVRDAEAASRKIMAGASCTIRWAHE